MQKLSVPRKHISILTYLFLPLILTFLLPLAARANTVHAQQATKLEPNTITKHPEDCRYGSAPYGVAYICTDAAGKHTTPQQVQDKQAGKVNPTEGCSSSTDANPMIFTGLGCIPTSTEGFTAALLIFLAGISGAVALIIMLIGTIQIMTGGDNAEQVKKGKELFTGAITGLVFIIFSVTLLKIVAGDIIQLPFFKV